MKLKYLTALYSALDQEYNQVMSGPYEDLSFHDDDCKVIAGLKDNRISGFWRPVVAVGDDRYQKIHIERLYEICPNICYMDFLIDGQLSVISQFLLRHGHRARPYYTQVIDLDKPFEALKANLRKSYKSLVNKPACRFMNIGEYRKLHEKTKKRTRADETWAVQEKMKPTIIGTTDGKSAVMIVDNGYCCYYFSGCGDNCHSCMWWSIMSAKERGCKTFELGEQIFSGDPKLVNISKFKRGFGGRTQTRLILEK